MVAAIAGLKIRVSSIRLFEYLLRPARTVLSFGIIIVAVVVIVVGNCCRERRSHKVVRPETLIKLYFFGYPAPRYYKMQMKLKTL